MLLVSESEFKKKPFPSLSGTIRYHTVKKADKEDSDDD